MRLNADIVYHNLKQVLDVEIYGMCENRLSLFRPEFYLDRTSRFQENHVYVCSADHLPDDPVIEDNVLFLCVIADLIIKEFNRLHCRMNIILFRLVELEYCCLFAIGRPKMARAVFPAIETRLMLPLIVLASHNK